MQDALFPSYWPTASRFVPKPYPPFQPVDVALVVNMGLYLGQ